MSHGHLDQLLMGIADAPLNAMPQARRMVISGLTLDSREVVRGDAFFALRGTRGHGIEFAADAVDRGAQVVLAEAPETEAPALDVPLLWIDDLHQHVGEIASRFYGRPSEAMHVIGITGTNGKTSCVQLLAQALSLLGHRSASIGTLGAGMHGELRAGERTTPDALAVHRLLASFRDAGATHVAMEVSSHALAQGRVGAVDFELAAFTNLTRDHLDYHGSMEAYAEAKAVLFRSPGLPCAVINVDDAFGQELIGSIPADVNLLRFSMADDDEAEVAAAHIVTSAEGLSFHLRTPWGARQCSSALLGRFNVANLLVVAACLGALGESIGAITRTISQLRPVNGRMNRLGGTQGLPLVVVDYAHTPDALEQALTALRAHCAGRLICVFGCGGERDPGKRPLMGAIVARLADVGIVTDDNPRGEDGDAIVAQILAGMDGMDDIAGKDEMNGADASRLVVQRDRAAAIGQALQMAQSGDVVLVAGKGHETYQETAQGKHAFDDLAVAHGVLERRQREPRA